MAGLITALPVVGVFIAGLVAGDRRGAIAVAVDANLKAIASLVGAPRLSLRIAVADTVVLGASVFIGALTSATTWLHVL
ncbi:MAG: hypothetical protein WAN30_03390 [Acidimicrobiales bacterium]